MADTEVRHPFTVDEWHRMDGVLDEDARVELVEGDVIQMAPIGTRHVRCVVILNQLFSTRLGARAFVSVQNPLTIGTTTELLPDFTLLAPSWSSKDHNPRPDDVYLVVEVSDSSLRYDRERKLPLYAGAGVPEVWIVDLSGDRVHRYSSPAHHPSPQYRTNTTVQRGESLSPQAFADLKIPVDALLGPRDRDPNA